MSIIKKFLNNLTAPIDTEAGALNNIPNFIIQWSVFMSANAILQAIVDVVVEMLMITHIISFKVEFRLEFLLLTVVSTVIAYLTLKALREGSLDITKNTLLIGLIVESSLVIGDIYLLFNTSGDEFLEVFLFRLPFMLLTSSNIYIISYIIALNIRIKRGRPNYKF